MNTTLVQRVYMLGKNFLSRQESISEQRVCESERGSVSGYESVITNVQTMCRHAFVSAWVCVCMWVIVWDYVVISTIWKVFANGIKTIGCSRRMYSKASWPGDFRLLRSLSRGYSGASAGLSACWAGFSTPGSLARSSAMHMPRLHPVWKLCRCVWHDSNQRETSCWLQNTVLISSQDFPDHKFPSQSVFSAKMHVLTPHCLGPNYKRRENQNWLLIELPGWMLMVTTEGYFIPREGCKGW